MRKGEYPTMKYVAYLTGDAVTLPVELKIDGER